MARMKKVKKFIIDEIQKAGEKGIRLDRLVDKANQEFVNIHVSGEFILEFVNKQPQVETFFIPQSRRMLFAFRMARKSKQ